MGKSTQGILGNYSGKVGNVVGRIKGGRTIISVYQGVVANPRTINQLIARQKFSVLSKSASLIDGILKIGMKEVKKATQTAYNKYMSLNKTKTIGSYPNIDVDYSNLIIAKGTLVGLENVSAQVQGLDIELSFMDNSNSGNAKASDLIAMVAVNKQKGCSVADYGNMHRSTRNVSLECPPDWSGDSVELYAFFYNEERVSNSVYIGSLTLS